MLGIDMYFYCVLLILDFVQLNFINIYVIFMNLGFKLVYIYIFQLYRVSGYNYGFVFYNCIVVYFCQYVLYLQNLINYLFFFVYMYILK